MAGLVMGVARVASRAQIGLAAPRVEVEVHLGGGLPNFSIVGLPATAVKESKDRVRAALANSGFEWPAGRITVNLSPADLPKEGCRYDLPIALGILLASAQIAVPEQRLANCEFYGELGLAGELRPIRGVLLAAANAAREQRALIVPAANVCEARIAAPRATLGADTLLGVCALARGQRGQARRSPRNSCPPRPSGLDLADVRGQAAAKRALVVAAAGGHSLLLVGPPGTGKSMLAQRLPGLLPPLDRRRGARRRGDRLGERARLRRDRLWTAAVSRAAPHRFGGRHHRRRIRRRARARSASRIAACCSSTNCRSSTAPCSSRCASRSRAASSPSRAPRCRWNIRRASSWSPP